ncbi:MAG TPA: Ig-like domain-containing protein [Candidatus Dormibacteraeota bacterium]
MSTMHDPELDDILQDAELKHVADLLRAGRMSEEPPLDDAFRSALRRQLMNRAWGMGGTPSVPWWRKAFGPAGLAWAGAAVGVVLIAAAVVFTALTSPSTGGLTQEVQVTSPMNDQSAVRLQQPILVNFNQPMDHPSTEGAVQITPATTVAFSWSANTLSVQPTSGNLAPNTQYQVTIGPGAKTASGGKLAAPQTITFVTAPPAPSPSPTPTPVPSPTPRAQLPDQHQLVGIPAGATDLQWAPDSSTVYFITANGALDSIPAAGGTVTVLVPDSVTSAALAPAGDRMAVLSKGKIDILDLKARVVTSEISSTPAPLLVGWEKDRVEWAAADGIYAEGADLPGKVASFPTGGSIVSISFAPDGAHLAYTQNQSLYVFDIASGKGIVLGLAGAQFLGWSPDGTGVMYSTAQGVVVSDAGGKTAATLPAGEPTWSSQDEILLGSDTDLWEVRPDGTGLTKLAEGTYHFPAWAPNGVAFIYLRGGGVFGASAPAPPPRPSALDSAAAVVNSFMQARKSSDAIKASTYLDDNGRKAYSSSGAGLNLVVTGDPAFSRYYLLTQSITGSQPDTAQFVVRIVLSHDKLDVSTYEETLTLVRTQGSQQFLVDQASAGPLLTLGKGAEVVSVEVSPGAVKITFDSDLKPESVATGVIILDSKGKQVGGIAVYANRTVTIGGLDLKVHDTYKLVVLSTVQDVSGTNIAAEYDLTFVGPADAHGGANKRGESSPSPTPQASPSAAPSSPPSS